LGFFSPFLPEDREALHSGVLYSHQRLVFPIILVWFVMFFMALSHSGIFFSPLRVETFDQHSSYIIHFVYFNEGSYIINDSGIPHKKTIFLGEQACSIWWKYIRDSFIKCNYHFLNGVNCQFFVERHCIN
jgi:hypothetical protein